MTPANTIEQITKDVAQIAADASVTAMSYFRNLVEVETKEDESPVTVADKQVETEIRAALQAAYPEYGIFGEEFGAQGIESDNYWVVDPIDGTRSFISGLPLFGMLLGLVHAGKPVMGLVGMPALNEVYIGQPSGATMNGQAISASTQTDLSVATIFINEGEKLAVDEASVFAKLCTTGKTRRFSYDCYPHALLAAGHIDAVVDYDLKPYDYLPVVALVEAAGGLMTDWQGNTLDLNSDGRVLSAATPELLAQLITLVNGGAA